MVSRTRDCGLAYSAQRHWRGIALAALFPMIVVHTYLTLAILLFIINLLAKAIPLAEIYVIIIIVISALLFMGVFCFVENGANTTLRAEWDLNSQRVLARRAAFINIAYIILLVAAVYEGKDWIDRGKSEPAIIKFENDAITFKGSVEWDGIKNLSKALVEASLAKPNGGTIQIKLDSDGGNVGVMMAMIDLIKAMPSNMVIETAVTDGGACMSACVPIWLTGKKKSIGRGSVLMVHQAYEMYESSTSGATAAAATVFRTLSYMSRHAIIGSEVEPLIKEQFNELYEFARREGVWKFLRPVDCYLTGPHFNAAFPGYAEIVDQFDSSVPAKCLAKDPRKKKA